MSLVTGKRIPCWALTLMLVLWFNTAAAVNDLLAEIQNRGTLLVGVKADVPSWGELDKSSGKIVGLEPDLARDLAERLGVALKLVPVLSAERVSALETREVDVVIATLNVTPERLTQLTLVSPYYYESGAGLLARRSEGFRQWSELRNRRICSRRGSFYNRPIAVEYGADIVALYSAEIALAALRDGRCDGFLGDTAVFAVMLQDRELAKRYEMTLPALYPTGWAVALHRDERGGRLEAAISQAIIHWFRSGLLGRLEAKWGIPRSEFSRRMEADWPQTPSDPDHVMNASRPCHVMTGLPNTAVSAVPRNLRGAYGPPRWHWAIILLIGCLALSTAIQAKPPRATVETRPSPLVTVADGRRLARDIARIVERGELVVAMADMDTPPFFYLREGRLVGLEVEMANDLARELQVAVRFNRQAKSFNEVIDLVARQEADVGISKLSRTLARAQRVRFSEPYLRLNHALAFNRLALAQISRDRPVQTVVRDFSGTIGVIANSSFADFAAHHFPRRNTPGLSGLAGSRPRRADGRGRRRLSR